MGVKDWASVLKTCNVGGDPKKTDPFTKLLLSTRACVLPATWTATFIGFLISLSDIGFSLGSLYLLLLLLFALSIAHMTNNLYNDYFDSKYGIDTPDYVRTQYSPHPILAGLMSKRTLLTIVAIFTTIDFVIMIYLYFLRGWFVVFLAVLGYFISFNYAGPPLKLKYHGLGEFSNFLVWGPLMTVGTYYVFTGFLTIKAILLSIPYGILMFYSLAGKHMDKVEADKKKGLGTLPIVLGMKRTVSLIKGLLVLTYVYILVLIFFGYYTLWGLLVLLTLPKTITVWKVISMKKPAKKPLVLPVKSRIARFFEGPTILKNINFEPKGDGNWPIWPLWYIVWLFSYSKKFGYYFVLALFLHVLIPLNWDTVLKIITTFFNLFLGSRF